MGANIAFQRLVLKKVKIKREKFKNELQEQISKKVKVKKNTQLKNKGMEVIVFNKISNKVKAKKNS